MAHGFRTVRVVYITGLFTYKNIKGWIVGHYRALKDISKREEVYRAELPQESNKPQLI